MQDIITEEITNSPTFQDSDTVSPHKKSFDTYGRMDLDMSVTENQHKKQTKICVTTKLEIVTTDILLHLLFMQQIWLKSSKW